MMTFQNIDADFFRNYIGRWLRFGGYGILDGLKNKPVKVELYKLIKVQSDCLVLRGYKRHRHSILPNHKYNQTCQVITTQEFKNLSTF